ncbi:MAG: hypothetical protein HY22_12530 [[Candidatus Thermochlorobacteriaceae] bacterium GBChlB]|nr:MAG: hypothetical protein HY22_12530 [[Candidatus Thermochlorobacteriaceae] bacterium GBChlB]
MKLKLQFTAMKLAIAWMFALVTINFNRVAMLDVGIPALLVATMIGLYPLFGPFQPFFGRVTNRFPIWGYRRSPYLILGMLAGSMVFPFLPSVMLGIASTDVTALTLGFLLFFVFGTAIALMANTFLDLIADCTTEETRSGVFSMAWTGQTLIIVVWAIVFRAVMPEFSIESMQTLYNLTPFIVMTLATLSVLGLEKRRSASELALLQKKEYEQATPQRNPLKESVEALKQNRTAQQFFLFVMLCFLGIFLQDLLQELLGGEVFGMSVGETTVFQQIFNGTVTLGMALTAMFGARAMGRPDVQTPALPMSAKKQIASLGGFAATATFVLIAIAAVTQNLTMLFTVFALNGFFVGVFTFASVTMMSDMTVEGETGKYLGIWSMAQALGLGLSFIASGALYEMLVQRKIFVSSAVGYGAIFLCEAAFMFWCVWSLRPANVDSLRQEALLNQAVSGESRAEKKQALV